LREVEETREGPHSIAAKNGKLARCEKLREAAVMGIMRGAVVLADGG
jgi:hypothetical protein